jgi:hypothetical protein
MLLAVAVFALLLGMLLHFWPHLLWRLGPTRVFRDVQRVPSAPMPVVEAPEDWVRCRFGSLEFELPRGLAEGFRTDDYSPALAKFTDGTRSIEVVLPRAPFEEGEFFQQEGSAYVQLRKLSPAELRLAMFGAGWDEFRWDMTHEELRSHMFLVNWSARMHTCFVGNVETLLRSDIEGLLADYRGGWAVFEWYTAEGDACGYVLFSDNANGDIDLSWVRPICHSLRFSGACYPDAFKDEEPADLYEIIEP